MTRDCLEPVTHLCHTRTRGALTGASWYASRYASRSASPCAVDARSVARTRLRNGDSGNALPPHTLDPDALTPRQIIALCVGLYTHRIDRGPRDHVPRRRSRAPRSAPRPHRHHARQSVQTVIETARDAARSAAVRRSPSGSTHHQAPGAWKAADRPWKPTAPPGNTSHRSPLPHSRCSSTPASAQLRLRCAQRRRRARALARPAGLHAVSPERPGRHCFQFVMSASSSLPPGCPSRPSVERSYPVRLWSPGLL